MVEGAKKLRIGLLLDALEVDAWMYEMVKRIEMGSYAEVRLIVLNDAVAEEKNGLFDRIRRNRGRIFERIFRKVLDFFYRKLVVRQSDRRPAFGSKKISELLPTIKTISVKPEKTQFSDFFSAADIELVRQADLDVLVRGGFRILRGDILTIAKYGVWSYHHGDNTVNRGGPAGFWEAMESWPVTGSILQILNEDLDNGLVLHRSWSSTVSRSPEENRDNYYWKTSLFLPRKLKELHEIGSERFFQQVAIMNTDISLYSKIIYGAPNNAKYLQLICKNVYAKILFKFERKFYFDQWFLMYHFENKISGSLRRFKTLIPPADRFWADPSVIEKAGVYYIFIEELIFERKIGHISVITMDDKGNASDPVTVLKKPYHLSYPYVFQHDGEYYMIPETGKHRAIALYKCSEFPYKWEFSCNLIENIEAYDSSVFFKDGKWWMFANVVEIKGASSCDELFLFYADDLFSSNWQPHPKNPLVSDARNARPAGRIFERQGQYYRPAQDCSKRYGYGFNFNIIETINETEYRETLSSKVEPLWDPKVVATHTFSHDNGLTVIDAEMKRRR